MFDLTLTLPWRSQFVRYEEAILNIDVVKCPVVTFQIWDSF